MAMEVGSRTDDDGKIEDQRCFPDDDFTILIGQFLVEGIGEVLWRGSRSCSHIFVIDFRCGGGVIVFLSLIGSFIEVVCIRSARTVIGIISAVAD